VTQIDSQHSALSHSHAVCHSSPRWPGICRPPVGVSVTGRTEETRVFGLLLLVVWLNYCQ
jgi:hypothetical protein